MEDLHFMRLWDLYQPLLTATQREITDLYFNCDLSLAEIAEQKGVSRQSVSDCLKQSRKQLEQYEEKLGFLRLLTEGDLQHSFLLTDISRWAEKTQEAFPATGEAMDTLRGLLEKDYSQEVRQAIQKEQDNLL
jgi:hypothetical protein